MHGPQRRDRDEPPEPRVCRVSLWCGVPGHPRLVAERPSLGAADRAEQSYRCAACGRGDVWIGGGRATWER